MEKIQYEAIVRPGRFEDGGRSMSCDVMSQPDNAPDDEFFVEFKSWVESGPANEGHVLLKELAGKKVKITIEVLSA